MTGVLERTDALAHGRPDEVVTPESPFTHSADLERLVRPGEDATLFKQHVEKLFSALKDRYESTLSRVLQVTPGIIAGAVIIMMLVVPFYMFSVKELAPREDQGVLFGIVVMTDGAAVDEDVDHLVDLAGPHVAVEILGQANALGFAARPTSVEVIDDRIAPRLVGLGVVVGR